MLNLMKCSEAAAAIIRSLQDKDVTAGETAAIFAIGLSAIAKLTGNTQEDALEWLRTCPVWDADTKVIDLGDDRILLTNADTAEALAYATPTKGTH